MVVKANPPPAPAADVSEFGRVMAVAVDPTRLAVLVLLSEFGPVCVGDLCARVGASQPATSHHLSILKLCGLIEFTRSGKKNIYDVTTLGRAVCGFIPLFLKARTAR